MSILDLLKLIIPIATLFYTVYHMTSSLLGDRSQTPFTTATATLSTVIAAAVTAIYFGATGILPKRGPVGDPLNTVRLFAGPSDLRTQKFGANSIIVFKKRATSEIETSRQSVFCNAYVAVFEHGSLVEIDDKRRMALFWPIDTDSNAKKINDADRGLVCDLAVEKFGLDQSRTIIDAATDNGFDMTSVGPWLFSDIKLLKSSSQENVIVTVNVIADLSSISNQADAEAFFDNWRRDFGHKRLPFPNEAVSDWDSYFMKFERFMISYREWLDRAGGSFLLVTGIDK